MVGATDPKSQQWRSAPHADLVWCGWGDDYVAFHRPSGKTHYLNDASERLLTQVLLEPMTALEVAEQFVEDGTGNDRLVDEMTAMLQHLEDLGLVERL